MAWTVVVQVARGVRRKIGIAGAHSLENRVLQCIGHGASAGWVEMQQRLQKLCATQKIKALAHPVQHISTVMCMARKGSLHYHNRVTARDDGPALSMLSECFHAMLSASLVFHANTASIPEHVSLVL